MKQFYTYLFSLSFLMLNIQVASAIDFGKKFSQLFIENKGQVKDEHNNGAENVLFYSQGKEMQVFITTAGYSIIKSESDAHKTTYHKIDFKLENASIRRNQLVFVKGDLPAFNFYHGAHRLEDVASATIVIIRNIYPGIDWVWTFDANQNVKHEFMVNLGADAKQIGYSVAGATARLSNGNNLIYSSEAMQVKEGPVVLQQAHKKDFAADISLRGNRISFQIPASLASGGFTIDPPLELLWGATLDSLRTSFKSITADNSLNTITVGYSSDYAVPVFPQVTGSYNVFPAKATDIIIMKTDPNQNLIWATFFGGVANDQANAVTASPSGIFITGYSDSWDFPHSIYGNYTQPVQLFGTDAFIAKFNNIGKWLWATGYGGNLTDEGLDIKHYSGKLYVAGYTASRDFPVLAKTGAYNYQDTMLIHRDAFLLEFDSAGNRLWATTFGGSGNDYFTSVFADASGLYTTGYSDSITGSSIPLLNAGGGAYFQNTFSRAESFINRFSTVGALNHSSYFGGKGNDYASCIVRNNCGLLICGKTDSVGLPVLSQFNGNYFQAAWAGGHDGFIAKFDANTLQQRYSTYYGSSGEEVLTKMASDASCHTITTGYTNSNIGLVGSKTYYFIQDSLMGGYDALMLGLDNNQVPFWATTFGSRGNDFGYSVWFPHRFRVDMVGEGLYDYGKWRIGGTYRNYPCSDLNICPKVTSNGCSNRFFNRDSVTGILGGTPVSGGGGGGGGFCAGDLQFQALIPTKNTCPNMCNGEAVMDTANIGGCPPYQLTWNNGDVGIKDTALCEFYWSIVTDASGQQRVIYGRFDVLRILYAENAYTYCSGATPFWDTLIHVTGGGPPYFFDDRGGTQDSCPIPRVEFFDIIDTAGCILSYSLPWLRTNIDLQMSFVLTQSCKLVASAHVQDGTCINIPLSTPVTIYDGVDSFFVPYSSIIIDNVHIPTFNTLPGRYYTGYLNLPDCRIPITGIYRLATFNDSVSKVLACQADSGIITISIPADTNAFSHLSSYNVTVSIVGDSSGIADSIVLTYTNSTTQAITFDYLPADNYHISIYSNDCDAKHSLVSLKTVYFQFNSPNTYCGRSDTLKASMLGGFPPYNFVWSPNAPNAGSIQLTTGGNYSVTVTDSHGCVFSGTKQVPGSSQLNITSLVENMQPCSPTLFSAANVSAAGGTLPYSYVWSSGESTPSASYLAQGTNWVRVFDGNGCASSDTFQNTKKPKLNVSETHSNPTCFRFHDGSISLTVSDGYPAYTINWVGGNTTSAVNLAAGNYPFTVTDSKGCTVSGLQILTEPDSIRYFEFTNDANCSSFDGYANISVIGGSGTISMLWDDGNVNFTRFDLNGGSHLFRLTDINGCYQDGEVNVGVYNPPLNYQLTTTDVLCHGNNDGTAILTVNNFNPPITYLWSNGENGSSVFDFTYGPYQVLIKDAAGCSYTENIFIDEPDPLYIYNIQTANASCSAYDGYASVSISGGTAPYSVNWSDGGTGTSRNNLQSGWYGVTVTDDNLCQTFSNSIYIPKIDPMLVNLTTSGVSCFGSTDGHASVSVTNALTPVSYFWSTGGQVDHIDNLHGGNYTLTISDNRGCTKVVTAVIYEPSLLVAAADTGTGILCYGQTAQVNIYASGGTFPYSGAGYLPFSSGTHHQTITDLNGCTASVTFQLSEPAELVGSLNIVQPSCTNGGGTVTINSSGGTPAYDIWYASFNMGSSTGSITVPAVNGLNTVQVIDNHGCSLSLSALVDNLVEPAGNVAYTIDPLCAGGSTGAANIVMSQGANPFTLQGFSFTDSTTIHNLSAGTYTYTVTDANNCQTTLGFTLHDPPLLTAGSDVVQNFVCSSDSALVSIFANGGTGSYTGTGSFHFAGGSYSNPVTDGHGCVASATFILTPPPVFSVDTYLVKPNCLNNFGYVHIYPKGGVPPYSLNNGSGITTFSDSITLPLLPGNYTYSIADSLGCLRNVSFVLNNVGAVEGNMVTQPAHCYGDSSGSLMITMTKGVAPYQVNGLVFSDSVEIGNLAAGFYQYTVSDANNCTVILSGTIFQPTALVVDSISILTTVSCTGKDDAMLKVFAHGGTLAYTYMLINDVGDTTTQAGNVFTALSAGTYDILVTDSLGCTTGSMAVVDTFHHAHHRIEREHVNCYGKNNGAIKLNSEPANRNPYRYSLNNQTQQEYNVFYNLAAGSYQVIVNDKFDCPDTLYTSISQPDSVDGNVWLNGKLLPFDSLELDERLFAGFTKQSLHPWEIEFSPDVQRLIQSLNEIKILPREDITFTVTVFMDSFDRSCFVQHKGLIELRNVPMLPNIITPNGDGFNDIWEIDLDKFPNSEVTIFDRWGEIIYESKSYANDWDAMYHGKHVADGTYFYLLKVPARGDKVYKGNINVLNSTN